MTLSLQHEFVSAVPDGADASEVQPSHWNAQHVITLGGPSLVGRDAMGAGAAEELSVAEVLALLGWRLLNANGLSQPQFEIYADDGITQANLTAISYAVDGGGTFHANHARGTRAVPSATLSGDVTGGIGSRAYHSGGAFQTSSPAAMHWVASQNQTGAAHGMYLRFLTTPQGATTRQERVVISDNGTLWSHDTGTFDPKITTQTKPIADINILASASASTGASVGSFAYDGTAGFRAGASKGTAASPAKSIADQLLSFFGGHGYEENTPGWTSGTKALLGFKAAEDFTSTAQGTYITLETTPIGSTTRAERMRIGNDGLITVPAAALVQSGTAIPAGGTAGAGYRFSSTSNFGVFFGSGAPSLAAAQGSIYLRSDGAPYVNKDGSTVWAELVPQSIEIRLIGVNFNSANTDNAVNIVLPPGFTRYRISGIFIMHASASISTATFGVFTSPAGAGTAIVNAATALTVVTASESTNNNMQVVSANNVNTLCYNNSTLYFRVGTAQGSAATADVVFGLNPLP